MYQLVKGFIGVCGVVALACQAQVRIDDYRLFRNHERPWLTKYASETAIRSLPRRDPRESERAALEYAEHLFSSTEAKALVLIDEGEVVWERLKYPANRNSPFHGYSITKSVMSVGIGAGICSGLISLSDSMGENVPAFSGTDLGRARVRDLLMMASGATSTEPNGGFPELIRAVDFGGPEDLPGALLAKDYAKARRGLFTAYQPGQIFDYKNTDPDALALLFRGKTGRELSSWVSEAVLRPALVNGPVYIGADVKGHTHASYGMRMPLEDWIKLSVWIKEQSKGQDCFGKYLTQAMTRQIYNVERRTGAEADGYGYFFWTDMKEAPGAVWALGYGGQRIAWSGTNGRIMIAFSTAENWSREARQLFRLWNAAAGKP